MSEQCEELVTDLPPFDDEMQQLDVVIETPKGRGNKYAYDPRTGLFELKGVLPLGSSFPFEFGFIPVTIGGDGDPLDGEPAHPFSLPAAHSSLLTNES
jgi:inorganic pyrophosphatase